MKTIRCQRQIFSFRVQIGQHSLQFKVYYVLKLLHLSKSGINANSTMKAEQSEKSSVCRDHRPHIVSEFSHSVWEENLCPPFLLVNLNV